MKTGTGLSLVAIGAIFAFAITAHTPFLNIQVVGWILIITGVCGLLVPRRGHGWLRRSVLVSGHDRAASRSDRAAKKRAELEPAERTDTQNAPIERESIVEFIEK
jgi:hypothetical protein